MVLASRPVASLMRLAARPVGAHSAISRSRESRCKMQRMPVVLPVPGPPVMMVSGPQTEARTAWRCSGERRTPASASYWAIKSSTPASSSMVR